MRAIRCHRPGSLGALSLDTVPAPRPALGELLIRVRWASINPIDWKLATGMIRPEAKSGPPWGVGADYAGEVLATGLHPAGPAVGDRVFGCLDPLTATQGTFSELIAVPADSAFRLPDAIPLREAAALACAGFSAACMCDLGEIGERSLVLVNGASGGVGHIAVQLAKIRGASVTAVASGWRREFVLGLGADEFIDYTRTQPQGWPCNFDAILDCVATLPHSDLGRLLAREGRHVRSSPIEEGEGLAASTDESGAGRHRSLVLIPAQGAARELIDGYCSGRLKVNIESEHPISDAICALQRSMTGRVQGKLLVRIG